MVRVCIFDDFILKLNIFFYLKLVTGRQYGQANAFQIVRTFSRKSNVKGVVKNGFGVGSNHLGLHSDKEKDPGSVVGTKLRVLKYPNPLVSYDTIILYKPTIFLFYFKCCL